MKLCKCLFQPTRTVCWQTRLQLIRANASLTLISTVVFLDPNYGAVTRRTPMSGGVLERSTNALVHAFPWLLLMFALICIIQPATLDVASSSLTPPRLACIGNSNYAIIFAVTQRPYRFAGTLMKLSAYNLLSYCIFIFVSFCVLVCKAKSGQRPAWKDTNFGCSEVQYPRYTSCWTHWVIALKSPFCPWWPRMIHGITLA